MKTTTPKATKKNKPKPEGRDNKCAKTVKTPQKTIPKPQTAAPEPPKTKSEPKLNRRQQLFVQEYLVDLDPKAAAIRVGYSERSAGAIGNENLLKPNIKAVVDAEIEKRKAKIDVTAEQVIKELALIGFANMADFVEIDEGGAIRAFPLDTLSEGKSRIIKKVKEKRVIKSTAEGDQILDSTYEFELCDKVKSLELLSRHLGLLHDKTEVDLKQPVQITIKKFCSRKTAKDTHGSRATS